MERINKQKTFNYINRKNKWLGLIDYKTLVYGIIYIAITTKIIFMLSISYTFKLYLMVIFNLPLIIFVFLNLQEESAIDKLKLIVSFFITRKIYLKSNNVSINKTIYKNVEK